MFPAGDRLDGARHGPDLTRRPAVQRTAPKPFGWERGCRTRTRSPPQTRSTIWPPKGTPNTLFLLGEQLAGPGHDLFLRLLDGGQVSLEVGIGATIIALMIGVTLGVLAGWLGGLVDGALGRLTDLVMALPILLILLMVGTGLGDGLRRFTLWGVLNNGVLQLILLIGAFTWYYPARVARSQMLSLRHAEFVEASEMIGASGPRIVRKHLFPTSSRRSSSSGRSWSRPR